MLICCAVFDSAVNAYGRPFFCRARGEALRAFADEVQNKDTEFGRHPEDYALAMLGSFDEVRGELHPCAPEVLVRGKDVAAISKEVL